jgi:predicted HicB family RNase H-like nuclease
VNEKKEIKTTTVTFRIGEELKKKLESMAAKDNRSLSNFIIMQLEKVAHNKR